MTILYNCHTDSDHYRITKFSDGEVESSYLCSTTECQCPAGQRPSCRHRLMLPMFIARGAVNSFWFLDFERKGWVSNEPAELLETRVAQKSAIASDVEMIEAMRQGCLGNSERSELSSQQAEPAPLRFDMDYSNSVGHGPAYDALPEPSTKPSWRRL